MKRARLALAVSFALTSAAAASCSEAPRPVRRDGIDKMLLVPEQYAALRDGHGDLAAAAARDPRFYLRRHIEAATPGFTGVPRTMPLRIVRWEVSENFLVAVPADGAVASEPLAIYRIESHFDPDDREPICSGGETCEPGTYSRPWFQRRYMRVDWSTDLVSALPASLPETIARAIPSDPVPIFVNNPADPEARRMTDDLRWFELPERAVVHPERVQVAIGETTFDACEVFDRERREPCGPRELTMRTSFLRIDAPREMSPLGLGAENGQRFPALEVPGDLGASPVGVRHDLFARDHHMVTTDAPSPSRGCNRDAECATSEVCAIDVSPADAVHRGRCAIPSITHAPGEGTCERDLDCRVGGPSAMSETAVCDATTHTCGEHYARCQRDADCSAAGSGSVCDRRIAAHRPDGSGLCTLPLRTRVVEPIAIHETPSFPADIHAAAARAIEQWNGTLRDAIARARRHECQLELGIDPVDPSSDTEPRCNDPRVTGLDENSGDLRFVVVGCHSPVWGETDGVHSAADVARAHATGWDLAVCGAPGTSVRDGNIRYLTLEGTSAPSEGDVAWMNVAADPIDGHVVSARAVVSVPRLAALTDFGLGFARFWQGGIDPLGGMAESVGGGGAAHGPSGASALRSVHTISDDVASIPGAGGDPIATGLFGDGSNASDARFLRLRALAGDIATDPDQSLLAGALVDRHASEDLVSPFVGESAAMHRLRAAADRARTHAECGLQYTDGDLWRDPLMTRAPETAPPFDCVTDPALCIDGPIPDPAHDALDDVAAYTRVYLATAVLAHEVGHLLGLPHNLAGSADAVNYPDRYWSTRGHGHPTGLAPRFVALADPTDGRYESFDEERDLNDRVTASVMDLVDPFVAVHGPGRGDRAAVASAYTDTVEALRSVVDADRFAQYAFVTVGRGIQSEADLTEWQQGIAHRQHYTRLPTLVGVGPTGAPRLRDEDRFVVFANETVVNAITGWGDPRIPLVTNSGHPLVPYRAVSERDSENLWPALAYDRGADPYEMSYTLLGRWFGGGVADRYAPSLSLTPFAYSTLVRRRYAEPVRDTVRALLFADAGLVPLASRGGWPGDEVADLVPRATMVSATNAFLALSMSPDRSRFGVTTAPDGTTIAAPTVLTGEIAGLAVHSQFRDGNLVAIGSWFDRIAALEGLLESRGPAQSVDGRSEPTIDADFVTTFPDASLRWLGGVLAEDYVDQSVLYTTTGATGLSGGLDVATMTRTGSENPRRVDATHVPTQPALSPAMIRLLVAHVSARWPLLGLGAFTHAAAVWLAGERDVPSEATVSFTDPASGRSYTAFHLGTGAGEEGSSIGASALVHAETGAPANEAGVAARIILHGRDLLAMRARAVTAGDTAEVQRIDLALRTTVERLEALRGAVTAVGP